MINQIWVGNINNDNFGGSVLMKLMLRVLCHMIYWLAGRHHSRLSHLLLHLDVHMHRHSHLIMDSHVLNGTINVGRHVRKNARLEDLRVPVHRKGHCFCILERRLQSSNIYCVNPQAGILVAATHLSYQSEVIRSCNYISQGCVSDQLNRHLS